MAWVVCTVARYPRIQRLGHHDRSDLQRVTCFVGPPPAVQPDEFASHARSEVIGRDAPGQRDDCAYLGEVFGAVKAAYEVRFEPAALRRRQGAFEVVSDKLDRLLAGYVPTELESQGDHRPLPNS